MKSHNRIVWESGEYRVIEIPDTHADMDNLKGDIFNPKYMAEMHSAGMTIELLAQQEADFEELVSREGVYGYALEKWNNAVGVGWETIDSCWGFVGPYSETDTAFKHYIVDEMIQTFKEQTCLVYKQSPTA